MLCSQIIKILKNLYEEAANVRTANYANQYLANYSVINYTSLFVVRKLFVCILKKHVENELLKK